MKSIEEANIKEGTKVLVRVDWNVPVSETGEVGDTAKVEVSKKTIEFILNKGAKAILMSHSSKDDASVETIVEKSKEIFQGRVVKFVKDPWSNEGKNILESLQNGEMTVMENIRFWKGEEENDEKFAKDLAGLADVYVNEAFPVSHRAHASLVGVVELLPHFAGFQFLKEYKKLSEAFNPGHPFLVIFGGAKFETKLPLVQKFLETADDIFIGGALAAKASEMGVDNNSKIIFPVGDIAALDANTETLEILGEKIKNAKFVLWNGPLGNYEKGFIAGTVALARMLAESSAEVIIGGGDTLAAVKDEIEKEIIAHGFISNAGGAMLDFLAKGTLPGIEALEK